MNKQAFLAELRHKLSGLPGEEIEERLAFYAEMIDDRMEEGLTESEAVAGIGSADEIAAQAVAEIPLARLVKENISSKRKLRGWEIVLLILGAPLWLPLLIAAFAVILSLYIVLLALVISLWAVEISLWAGALGCVILAVIYLLRGFRPTGIAALGAGLVCAGVSVFLFFACTAASKGCFLLAKKAVGRIKTRLIRKEKAE